MRLSIELQDLLQHAQPNISNISVSETAATLNGREGAFMSYDAAFRDGPKMPSGMISDSLLKRQSFDSRPWVQASIIEVATGLNSYLRANADSWINVSRKPLHVLNGLWVKPSIRGILVKDKSASPVLVIARRSIKFDLETSLPFLMRGGYEFHLRDEPNFSDFRVLDLSSGEKNRPRAYREYRLSQTEMMPLAQFEDILVKYAEAAAISKYGLYVPMGTAIRDLFKS